MGGTCNTHWNDKKSIQNFDRETCREETTWRTQWNGCITPRIETNEHGNESLGSKKGGEFFD
jgi:hypothetical protein